MRKLIYQIMITPEGYYEGPDREIDWHSFGSELDDYTREMFDQTDLLLFGRVNYELMYAYWSAPDVMNSDDFVAKEMNQLPKIVFSKSLERASWQNTRLVKSDLAEEIKKLKQEPGKNIMLFGGSEIPTAALEAGLVDEIRLFISPTLIGAGRGVFNGLGKKIALRLLDAKTFDSGNVLLYYAPMAT